MRAKCFQCGSELIWGGDHDCEPEDDHLIVSNLTCPECNTFYLMYWGESDKEPARLESLGVEI